ncbi:MAG: ComF family protein [Acidimicrobiales bacterium]
MTAVKPMVAKRYWICSGCGQRATAPACRNGWCSVPGRPLQAVFSVGNYEGALRSAIVAYKYRSDLRWAPVFGALLHGFLAHHAGWFEEYAVICPVPSFVGPGSRRDWGHVELLCAELARLAGADWPVERLVVKSQETPPMSGRPRPARREIAAKSLPSALSPARREEVAGRRVLVVDDVCASGGTLLAVAGVLRYAGACEVAALVLARASWKPPNPKPAPVATGPSTRGPCP